MVKESAANTGSIFAVAAAGEVKEPEKMRSIPFLVWMKRIQIAYLGTGLPTLDHKKSYKVWIKLDNCAG